MGSYTFVLTTVLRSVPEAASMAKAMKAKKRVSKIAKGRFAKWMVFKGKKEKTSTGLTANDLVKNSVGKIVSKKKSALGKKFDRVRGWREAYMKARVMMGVRGFIALNGQTVQ